MEYGSAKFDENENLIQQPQYTPSTDIYRASYSDIVFLIRRLDYRYDKKPSVDFLTADFINIMDQMYTISKASSSGGISDRYFTKVNKNVAVFKNISDASSALIKVSTISTMSCNPSMCNKIFFDIYPITYAIK